METVTPLSRRSDFHYSVPMLLCRPSRIALLFIIAVLVFAPLCVAADSTPSRAALDQVLKKVHFFRLPNGLRVLMYRRGLAPVFAGAVTVRVGQLVNAGDEVGASGNSGRSTGPHLHYEVRRHGEALNPLPFIKAGRKIGRYLTNS